MIHVIKKHAVLLIILMVSVTPLFGQGETDEGSELARAPFESAVLIDNQTTVIYGVKTLEFNIQHRFGKWNEGYQDLYGLWAPSNIRMALSYVPINRLKVGAGLTKNNKVLDLNAKYQILHQKTTIQMPVNVTFYFNAAISTDTKDVFDEGGDRLSYFSQLLISRRINYWVSVQAGPSLTHFNFVNSESRNNDHLAISAMGQIRATSQMAFIFNFDQPMTSHQLDNPNPNLALGLQMSTSGHSFQIFVGNFGAIAPQYNNMYNGNNYADNEFLIGFNITRLWNL